MTISSIGASSTQTYAPPAGPGKEVREGMKSLQEALSSGDLEAAQTAYDSLMKALEEEESTASGSTDQRKQKLLDMLSQVGEALESGDLAAAQETFSANAPKGPPPGGNPPPPPPSDEMRDAMGSLAEALQSGSLEDAQDAYDALTSLLEQDSDDDANPMKDKLLSALEDVGSALQGGNLTTAQQLFSALTPRGTQGVNIFA